MNVSFGPPPVYSGPPPVYRAEIFETPDGGWFWRVHVDTPNGNGWHGTAVSFVEAARKVGARLHAIATGRSS